MNSQRKLQLNEKLTQIYHNGSGRTEGIIDDLLQEHVGGHTLFIHTIGLTQQHLSEDEIEKDKTFTHVELGLYKDGEGCIQIFDIPYSNSELEKLAARIDMAYYYWMMREPQILKMQHTGLFEYCQMLSKVARFRCVTDFEKMTQEEFETKKPYDQIRIVDGLECRAFLPKAD